MKKSEYFISNLRGKPVYNLDKEGQPTKRIGKVRHFIFHPHARKVVGFTVKRPDIALVAHRSDVFVAIDAFDVQEGRLYIAPTKAAVGNSALKRLGVKWDECLMWQNMPLMTEEGARCGFVGDVLFDSSSGQVKKVVAERGAATDALLGASELPVELIKGFKLGVGDALNCDDGEDFLNGAIIVQPEALSIGAAGGLAERAGTASAVVANRASNVAGIVKPKASKAAEKAGEAVNSGAYKLGAQLGKTKGMFSSFKEEYRRARDGEEGKGE